MYTKLDTREVVNPEMPMFSNRNAPSPKPALSSQRIKKGAAEQGKKVLDNNCSTPVQHHRKKKCDLILTPPAKVDLNDTLDQMYLIDILRTFHPTTAEYSFFSD